MVYCPDTDEINSNLIFPNPPQISTTSVIQMTNPGILTIGNFNIALTDETLFEELKGYGCITDEVELNEDEMKDKIFSSFLEQENLHPVIGENSVVNQ